MLDTGERAGIEERFETACNASSLKVEAEKGGAADLMIAAGWSDSRVGMALLRLHSEWDGSAKPKRATEAMIAAIAERLKADDEAARTRWGPPNPKAPKPGNPMVRARSESVAWYRRELRLLAQSLKSRASVLEQLTHWAILRGIDPLVVGPAVLHWLAPTCTVCDGHGHRKVQEDVLLNGRSLKDPKLSPKQCHACQGTGNAHAPEGSGRVLTHIDYVVQVARQSMKKRLRPGG
jgi:hypothetical protein